MKKKIKVVKPFFDRREDKYVYPEKTPDIEREEARAQELIKAGVCAEILPEKTEEEPTVESEVAETETSAKKVAPKKSTRK